MTEHARIFRSDHPDITAAVERWQEDRARFGTEAHALADELAGAGAEVFVTVGVSGTSLKGFGTVDGHVPEGMRRDHEGHLIPDARTRPGKRVRARMRSVRPVKPLTEDLPGMPSHAFVPGALIHPNYFVHDGTVWVAWTHPIPGVDLDRWRPARMSGWYLALEAHQDAAASEAVPAS